MSDVEKGVKEVTAAILSVDVEGITSESRFVEDLGAESIQSVELVAAFEAEFGIEMDEQDALACKTVGEAVKLISPHLESK